MKSKFIGFCKGIDLKFSFIKNKVCSNNNDRKNFTLALDKLNIKYQGAYWYLFNNPNSHCIDFIKSKPITNSLLDSILENL